MPSATGELDPQKIAPARWVRPSTHIDPAHPHWKYWQEWTDWPRARSFVVTNGREILAHGAVVPGLCRWSGASRRALGRGGPHRGCGR